MASCCDPRGCDRMFDDRFARYSANRYRKRGLDKTGRRIVELIAADGVEGASVLEVGGGIGDLQLELLQRGAGRTTNLELSAAYETQARKLIAEAGLADRVDRRIVDIAANPDQVESADVTVMHRVVCCYPDYAKLLGAVADHTRRHVVFSHPPRNLLSRSVIGMENLGLRLLRRKFRVFAHPPRAMLEVLDEHGLRPHRAHRGFIWHVMTATR